MFKLPPFFSLSLSLSLTLKPFPFHYCLYLSFSLSLSLSLSFGPAFPLVPFAFWFLQKPSVSLSVLCAVGSDVVTVEGIPFPSEITLLKPLALFGQGITDIEIHFLQIKFNAIGIYIEKEVLDHLGDWKGKLGEELSENDLFFDALVSAPVEKYFRIVVIKEIKGSQYGVQLESSVRDRLAAIDKFEEDEEEALEKVTEFFQNKYFKKDSLITFHFPAPSDTAQISFSTEGKEEVKMNVPNANVAKMIQKWYLGGTKAVSPSTVQSLAGKLSALLSL